MSLKDIQYHTHPTYILNMYNKLDFNTYLPTLI